MNDSISHENRPLNFMNSSRLWKHERLQVMSSMNSLRLWMTWTTQDRKLWALDVKNSSGIWITWTTKSWAQRSRCYEQLRVMVDMNYSRSWVKGSRCYEEFRDVDDMNDFMWWGQAFRCYDQHKVVDDMNDSGSHNPRPLDATCSLGRQVIWTTLGHEEKAINVMNNSGL